LYGVFPAIHANSLGEYGAIIAVVSLRGLLLPPNGKSSPVWYGLACTFGLAALLFSQTRSALGGFLVGAVLVLLFSKGKGLTTLLLSGAAALISVGGVGSLLWQFVLRRQSPELFQSLSGRVDWWEFGWQQFLRSPLTGLGAYTARFEVLAKLGASDISSIHNSFLEVVLGVGVLGLIPVLAALLGTWWVLIRSLRSSSLDSFERGTAVEALGVLGVISVRCLFTTHLIWHPSLQFLVVLGYAEFLRRRLSARRDIPCATSTVTRDQKIERH
jgi:O-antigen ligase